MMMMLGYYYSYGAQAGDKDYGGKVVVDVDDGDETRVHNNNYY